ncbi:MAG TPA: Asp23/Gls24 family envelope stress response protein [Pseudonocardia sp.]|jgi:hypothetical protein|nr:Asp23/Gls24 family envelope stress response protein [Pseudonocardia sp.]
MNETVSGHPLPCGRLVEDVFDELDSGQVGPHAQECEHCLAASRGLRALNDATSALLDDPAEPPAGLLDRVMGAVRAELRRGDTLTLPAPLGPAEVSLRAVAAVLRYAADSVPGVWARHCHVELDPGRSDAVHIQLSVSLRYGTGPLHVVLAEVRRRLAAAMAGQVGLHVESIDLELVDLWEEGNR